MTNDEQTILTLVALHTDDLSDSEMAELAGFARAETEAMLRDENPALYAKVSSLLQDGRFHDLTRRAILTRRKWRTIQHS